MQNVVTSKKTRFGYASNAILLRLHALFTHLHLETRVASRVELISTFFRYFYIHFRVSFDPEVLKVWKLSFISSVRGSEADVNLKVNLDLDSRNSKYIEQEKEAENNVGILNGEEDEDDDANELWGFSLPVPRR